MALLWFEGFSSSNSAIYANKYPESNVPQSNGSANRTGNHGLDLQQNTHTFVVGSSHFSTAADTIFFGFAYRRSHSLSAAGGKILEFSDGGVSQVQVHTTTDADEFEIRDGTGALLGTTAGLDLTGNTWVYVEIKLVLNSATGTVDVRKNGATSVLALTNVNTDNAATAQIDRITFSLFNSSYDYDVDDCYLCDNTGADRNTYLGAVHVAESFPTANGNYAQWTPNSNTNWIQVDEVNYSTNDYVESSVAGNKDTYVIPDVPAGSAIYGVQVEAWVNRPNGGTNDFRFFTRIGVTDHTGATQALADASFELFWENLFDSPATSAMWAEAEFNGAEFGYEVV